MKGKARSLDLGETVEVGLQNVTAKRVVDELAFALRVDQASVFQLLHVVRERCRTDGKTASDIATGTRGIVSADLLENLVAAWIGQRAGDEGKLAVCEGRALGGCHLTSTVMDMPREGILIDIGN